MRILCLFVNISLTTEPILLSILEELHIGPGMVLGFFKNMDPIKKLGAQSLIMQNNTMSVCPDEALLN